MTEKRVLIADDDEAVVDCLARRCQELGLRVERAYDGATVLQRVADFAPHLVILDVNMPGGDGLAVCQMLLHDPQFALLPMIVMTGRKDAKTIKTCAELQAWYVPKGPDVWSRIGPLVTDLLGLSAQPLPQTPANAHDAMRRNDKRHVLVADTNFPANCSADATVELAGGSQNASVSATDEQLQLAAAELFDAIGCSHAGLDDPLLASTTMQENKPWILCIDDDAAFSHALKLRFELHGIEVYQAFAGMAGYRDAFLTCPQAIVLDYELPNGRGDYVLRRLHENPVTRRIPVIVVTGRKDRALERTMYNLGATRFLMKPVEWNDLWRELRSHLPAAIGSSVS